MPIAAPSVHLTALADGPAPAPAAAAPDRRPALSVRGADRTSVGAFATSSVPLAADAIALTGGFPGADVLPIAELAQAYAAVLAAPDAGTRALAYHGPLGTDELRDHVGRLLDVDPASVLITNGALHSFDYALEALVDRGDVVVVEDPTYPYALRTLHYHGARVQAVPTDEDGLRVDVLADRLAAGLRPKAVYTIPDFQNPSGVTLSAERRASLLALADRYGFVVVSDNPYAQLRFAGPHVPDLDVESGLVVRAGTFSKTLGPGLRLGWAVVPGWLRGPFVRARLAADQHAGLLTQRVVEHVLATPGRYDDVVARARAAYAQRSAALVGALVDRLGDRIEAPAPQGGLFVWARLPGVDLAAVLDVARARGLDFTLGSSFDPTGAGRHADRARFAYSNATPDQLVTAAALFADAVDAVAGS